MPIDKQENEITHYLKAISMFDPEKDFEEEETKRALSLAFRKLIMSDDDQAKEFFTRFLSGVDKIIKDMGIIDKTATDGQDEVDMPADDTGGAPTDMPAPEEDESLPIGPGPAAPMNASYNRLLDMANSYIYM